jgi:hypothetical protein
MEKLLELLSKYTPLGKGVQEAYETPFTEKQKTTWL